MLPSLIPILVLSVAPLVVGIFLAFTDARLVRHPDYGFAGIDIVTKLAGNTLFWDSLRISAPVGQASMQPACVQCLHTSDMKIQDEMSLRSNTRSTPNFS